MKTVEGITFAVVFALRSKSINNNYILLRVFFLSIVAADDFAPKRKKFTLTAAPGGVCLQFANGNY